MTRSQDCARVVAQRERSAQRAFGATAFGAHLLDRGFAQYVEEDSKIVLFEHTFDALACTAHTEVMGA